MTRSSTRTDRHHPGLHGRPIFLDYNATTPVDPRVVNPADLAEAITDRTVLTSIMPANNETGTLQPITQLAAIARSRGVLFHIDAVRGAERTVAPGDTTLLQQQMAGLEPGCRTAFGLTRILELSYADAAAVCGGPVGTIRSRVARARDDLLQNLG